MKKMKSYPVKTMLVITVGFIIVFSLTRYSWALYTALTTGLIGVFSDYLSRKVEYLWMQLARLLSMVIPNILLGIVFYVVLFPVAVLSKLFGKSDPMLLKNRSSTIFKDINRRFDKESMEHPW